MNQHQESHEVRLAVLVSTYATPLAVLLVAMGVLLSQPRSPVWEISIGLLLFGIVFNSWSISRLKAGRAGGGLIQARLYMNLAVNTVIVYFLGGYWTPVWLLLALTPFATAIYGTKRRTLAMSLGVSCLLLGIFAVRGFKSPLDWGIQVSQAVFIILSSLLINELSALAKSAARSLPPQG